MQRLYFSMCDYRVTIASGPDAAGAALAEPHGPRCPAAVAALAEPHGARSPATVAALAEPHGARAGVAVGRRGQRWPSRMVRAALQRWVGEVGVEPPRRPLRVGPEVSRRPRVPLNLRTHWTRWLIDSHHLGKN